MTRENTNSNTLPPPVHLSDAAKAHWDRIVREYAIDCAASLILTSTLEAGHLREQAARRSPSKAPR